MQSEINKENNIDIPVHWKVVKLGDYVISVKGKKPKRISTIQSDEFSIPYVNIKAFEKNQIDEYTDGAGCILCEDGDFLMVWDGSRSGYVGKAIKGALGSTLVKLNFPNIDNNYAYYFLQSKFIEINTRAKGVGIPHVDPNLLWNYILPIPPLPEQQAIVTKIEELLSDLENGKQQLLTAQQQLKVYRQSLLKAAFEGAELLPFEQFIESSQNGLSKRTGIKGQEYKVLRLADISNNMIDGSNPRKIVMDSNEIDKYKIKTDDLICIRVNGSKDLVGKLVHVSRKNEEDNWAFCDHFIRFRLDSQKAFAKFFHFYFSTVNVRKYIHDNMVTSAGQNTVSQGTIKNILVPNYTRREQELIVEELESKLTVCDKIEETITQSLQQAEMLKQSILKRAFEGKLVALKLSVKQEKDVPIIPLISDDFPRKIDGIAATDLQAGIIAMVIDAHIKNSKHSNKLNHVKCEKISDLVERKLGISLERNAVKDAAGPDDYSHLKKVEHRASKTGTFKVVPLQMGHTYEPMRNMQKAIDKVKSVISESELSELNKLIETFLPFELEHAELIATLYAGWNNLLLQEKQPTDEEIVFESRENWSKRKLTIEREKFFRTLDWMKFHGYIPEGKGKMVFNGLKTKKIK